MQFWSIAAYQTLQILISLTQSARTGAEQYCVSSVIYSIIWLPLVSSYPLHLLLDTELLQVLTLHFDFSGLQKSVPFSVIPR